MDIEFRGSWLMTEALSAAGGVDESPVSGSLRTMRSDPEGQGQVDGDSKIKMTDYYKRNRGWGYSTD
jgi:hypothetical protein